MSQDGADLGIDAKRAVDIVIGGGDQPTEDERRTPAQMREYIEGAQPPPPEDGDDPYDYGECARWAANVYLRIFDRHPILVHARTMNRYAVGDDGMNDYDHIVEHEVGWYMKQLEPDLYAEVPTGRFGLTGFQFGWAINAVHYVLGAQPAENPAIITFG